MEEVNGLLDRMLTKSVNITLTVKQCRQICNKYHLTGAQLQEAIKQYCTAENVNLEEYREEVKAVVE